MFVTLEGIDGCGKSTVTGRLAAALKARGISQVWTTREPGGTDLGEKIRNLIEGSPDLHESTRLHLFLAARYEHMGFLIPHLGKGDIVICDRFADSTMVYQGMHAPYMERWLKANERTVFPTMPDLTILLDVSVETALKRLEGRGDRESQVRLEILRKRWLAWQEENNERIVRVPADDPLDTVVDRCVRHVLHKLNNGGDDGRVLF